MIQETEFKVSKSSKVLAFIGGILFLVFAFSGLSAQAASSLSQKLFLNPVFALIALRTLTGLLGILAIYCVFLPNSVYITAQYIRTSLVKPVLWQNIERIEKMTAEKAHTSGKMANTINNLRTITFYLKPDCYTEIKILGLWPKKTNKFQIIGQNLQEPDKLEEEIKKYFPGGIL